MMHEIDQYTNHINFKNVAQKIAKTLEETVDQALKSDNVISEFQMKQHLKQVVQSKANMICRQPMLKTAPLYSAYEIRDITYKGKDENGKLTGTFTFHGGYKRDTTLYGEPGYPGRQHGDLHQNPQTCVIYKWHESFGRWYNVYDYPGSSSDVVIGPRTALHQWWEENRKKVLRGKASNFSRYNSNQGGATIWGPSTTASGFGTEPWISNPNDHDKWGDTGGLGTGGASGRGGAVSQSFIKQFFVFTVDMVGLITSWANVRKEADAQSKNKTKDANNPRIERNSSEDTLIHINRYQMLADGSNRIINTTLSKEIRGYEQARKDSLYHANMETKGFYYKISIHVKNTN